MQDFYGVLNHTHDQESGTGSICVCGGGGGDNFGRLERRQSPDFRSPQAGISKLGPFLIGSYRLKGFLII